MNRFKNILRIITAILSVLLFVVSCIIELLYILCPTLFPKWITDAAGIFGIIFIVFVFICSIVYFVKKQKNKKSKNAIPPMPSHDEIVRSLYGRGLDYSEELKLCKVIYSKDCSKRFIVFERTKGVFKYAYEEICFCNEEEWKWFHSIGYPNPRAGWWEPKEMPFGGNSFFGTEKDAVIALKARPEYTQYFE